MGGSLTAFFGGLGARPVQMLGKLKSLAEKLRDARAKSKMADSGNIVSKDSAGHQDLMPSRILQHDVSAIRHLGFGARIAKLLRERFQLFPSICTSRSCESAEERRQRTTIISTIQNAPFPVRGGLTQDAATSASKPSERITSSSTRLDFLRGRRLVELNSEDLLRHTADAMALCDGSQH